MTVKRDILREDGERYLPNRVPTFSVYTGVSGWKKNMLQSTSTGATEYFECSNQVNMCSLLQQEMLAQPPQSLRKKHDGQLPENQLPGLIRSVSALSGEKFKMN